MDLIHEELPGQVTAVVTVPDPEGLEDLKVPPDERKKKETFRGPGKCQDD